MDRIKENLKINEDDLNLFYGKSNDFPEGVKI